MTYTHPYTVLDHRTTWPVAQKALSSVRIDGIGREWWNTTYAYLLNLRIACHFGYPWRLSLLNTMLIRLFVLSTDTTTEAMDAYFNTDSDLYVLFYHWHVKYVGGKLRNISLYMATSGGISPISTCKPFKIVNEQSKDMLTILRCCLCHHQDTLGLSYAGRSGLYVNLWCDVTIYLFVNCRFRQIFNKISSSS